MTTVLVVAAKVVFWIVALVILAFIVRHYVFALNRLFKPQRHSYQDLTGFELPSVTVLIPMHNEERVCRHVLEALVNADYPKAGGYFEVIPINDRSTDRTGEIVDGYAARYPYIKPFHRTVGSGGKARALAEALQRVRNEIVVVFDADYVPGPGLIKRLVAPFCDPEVGLTMGRVIPMNVGSTLLTRLLDLERSGGYQVDQQARYNLGLVAQYGGTVGGIRTAAIREVGGFGDPNCLADDTDLTFRMVSEGWKVAYVNMAECYEEVPESWEVRRRQVQRWAIGHTQCLFMHLVPVLRSRNLSWRERIDASMLLMIYMMAPVWFLGWSASLVLLFSGEATMGLGLVGLCAVMGHNALGNFATFYQVAVSALLDGSTERVKLLPFLLLSFGFSAVVVSKAVLWLIATWMFNLQPIGWDKTARARRT